MRRRVAENLVNTCFSTRQYSICQSQINLNKHWSMFIVHQSASMSASTSMINFKQSIPKLDKHR